MQIRFCRLCTFTLISLLPLFGLAGQAGAQGYGFSVLHAFCPAYGYLLCTDGISSQASLLENSVGNLYGTTTFGGANTNALCGFLATGCGTVFKVDSRGQETVLYSFCSASACNDGALPVAALIQDAAGNLYGTTAGGGNFFGNPSNCLIGTEDRLGCGTVFRVDRAGGEIVLYRFCSTSNCADGATPTAGLIRDAAGNLYGTTVGGGANGGGTVFKLDAENTGQEKVLYSFCSESNCMDGAAPVGLIQDAAGNLFGTTIEGGANNAGTVFKLDTTGHETVLYSFCSASNCADGASPSAGLLQDAAGNLFGAATYGGAHYANYPCNPRGCGAVFELKPPVQSGGEWTENVLYSFCSRGGGYCSDGAYPNGGLIQDARGKLYGTTQGGAATMDNGGACSSGCGTVFKLGPQLSGSGAWQEHVLYAFCSDGDCVDGQNPGAGLILDFAGNLYGTTSGGGSPNSSCFNNDGYCGAVFELTTGNAIVTLTSLPNPSKEDQPVTLSVVVSGAVGVIPTGSVTFEEAKASLGTVELVDGKASITTTFATSREFVIAASYSGDDNYKATKSKALKQVVEK